ncbi:MAG: DUF4954 family protein [Rikenellaceae bacterium]
MSCQNNYRELTRIEIETLEQQRGCCAELWLKVKVGSDFSPAQLWRSRFEGEVFVGEGVQILDSTVCNYILDKGVRVESVTRLECRTKSRFGNGVEVAVVNECGGRTVKIYDNLKAQTAYLWAIFRHRATFCSEVERMVEEYSSAKESELGYVGESSVIVGGRFIREVNIGRGVVIEGASLLCNGTLCDGARVGVDVKAQNFIAVEGSSIDSGATLERCFVGESAIVANGFTAVDSLFFANSHLENGEAASVFAGPYTVSHHKSSLLIAGMFSFFNAGSGSNQSNHLFKTGAVHQSIHPRGCKFASGAYIMAPAVEGAFTMVKGYHARHHDTLAFPFSYLIDDGDRSVLMPGANLVSYGTHRDIEKWGARDRRTRHREVINFQEHNPYVVSQMVTAVNTIHTLTEQRADAEQYIWNRVIIKPAHLKRGLGLYNKAIVSSLGYMLSQRGATREGIVADVEAQGEWIDVAGQYISQRAVERIISSVERGDISSLEGIDATFAEFGAAYKTKSYCYAYWLLSSLLGHEPTPQDIADAVSSAEGSREALEKMISSDMRKDCDKSMSVGYGLHTTSAEELEADYSAVRGL